MKVKGAILMLGYMLEKVGICVVKSQEYCEGSVRK